MPEARKPLKALLLTPSLNPKLPSKLFKQGPPANGGAAQAQREKGTWKFDRFELDEVHLVLRGAVKPVAAGTRPWLLLTALLEAKGERVEKEKLMKTVWATEARVDDTLKVVIRSLRQALSDESHAIIVTTPGGGYRIGVRVDFEAFVEPQKFRIAEGMPLPGKDGWTIGQRLGNARTSWVWMAGKDGTNLRVVRFAEGQQRHRVIHREYEITNLLATKAPATSCFVRVLGEHRDQQCHYIETEIAGEGLSAWTAARQRDGGLSRELALNIMIQICDAVAALHQLGFVHNDLRPDNILVAPTGVAGEWHVKLTGLGTVVQLEEAGSDDKTAKYSPRNPRYRPPEMPNGDPGTESTDVYALGILTFQLLRGDFSVSPTGAWQNLISSEVLRSDIEEAVAQDPRSRLKTASDLATRLRLAESRQLKLDLGAARRRLMIVASGAGIALAFVLTILVFVARARVEERNAAAIDTFLTEDLLRESNPAYGKGVKETLHEAIERIRPRVEVRFSGRPRIAAQVHEEIAEALANEADVDGGGAEFDAAATDWAAANDSENAIVAQLEHALLLLKSQRAGSLDAAKQLLNQEMPAIRKLRYPSSRVAFAQLDAEGLIALMNGDLSTAKLKFQNAVNAAGADTRIPLELRLSEQARLCYIQAHTGEADQAAACFRSLIPRYKTMYGDASGPVLNLRVNFAQALMLDKEFAPALQEATDIYPQVAADLGPTNQVTQTVLGVRAQSEEGLGKTEDAITDMIAISETAKKTDPTGFLAIAGQSDAAKLECDINRLKSGEEHAREALAAALSINQNRGLLGQAQYSVAYCILATQPEKGISAPRLAEAGQLLDSIDVPSAAAMAGEPEWGANVDLAKAQLAFALKQYCLAAKYLASAKPPFTLPGSDQVQLKTIETLDLKLRNLNC